ncbi:uncharacterized protein BXIN_0937 [Babesia sp. Xinjiang]|uniref:uncharacterized protein n=1 Tax=Babesia sp. Xinjiang TaxID=462227 RepID=UPI000A25C82E|nr:uncharacterized protein BXIN_0937 [Babesia sp. Xinjiang]ORM42057.1 hypothetical protein BXIN_0937 [Babesia sp. Xinjiang]
MPRGGHRGCLFAVSGRAVTAFGRRRKRGLYHHCTNEIFRPSWGPLREPRLLSDVKLPNWSSDALSGSEKLPPKPQYSRDARLSWPQERRFKRLESIIRQSDSWRSVTHLQEASANPFPHVNESASLVRNLGLSDVLHTRSNHRLARRAHPKWYAARYHKFMYKKRLQEKLLQLKLESGA